jgi:hypothetical protein
MRRLLQFEQVRYLALLSSFHGPLRSPGAQSPRRKAGRLGSGNPSSIPNNSGCAYDEAVWFPACTSTSSTIRRWAMNEL